MSTEYVGSNIKAPLVPKNKVTEKFEPHDMVDLGVLPEGWELLAKKPSFTNCNIVNFIVPKGVVVKNCNIIPVCEESEESAKEK